MRFGAEVILGLMKCGVVCWVISSLPIFLSRMRVGWVLDPTGQRFSVFSVFHS